nr:MAG TPA: hypothetical protein [Bacteriophage sp.]
MEKHTFLNWEAQGTQVMTFLEGATHMVWLSYWPEIELPSA